MTYKQLKDELPADQQLCVIDTNHEDYYPSVMLFCLEDKTWQDMETGDIYDIELADYWMPCPRAKDARQDEFKLNIGG